MKKKFKFLKKIIFLLFIQLLFSKNGFTENIKDFNIQGNDRVSDETIIMFSSLNIDDNINENDLNEALKKLYYTDYFKQVEIYFDKQIVTINVIENPIIQNVKIEGIDRDSIYEKIEDITSKIEKYPFVENKINEQVILLKNILKSYGYYFVKLETSINENSNNTVDLQYKFDLGEIAKIKKINFIGEKIYNDTVLRNIIISEETKFWKFITKNKFLDLNRIRADVSRLEKFYKNRGFYNVKIKSTTAVITDENQFELIFNIKAGNKLFFDNIQFSESKNILENELEFFNKKFLKLKGKNYSEKKINRLIDDINNFTLNNEFVFLNASYDTIITDNNKIDIIINLDDLDKKFVDRINILGNFITDEKVVRNTLIVDEGDPFNEILFEKSLANIKSLGIFKSVNYDMTENNKANKVIDIRVEEQPTGEIFAGAGTGTTGSSISAGIKENNYLGLGIKLDSNLTLTDDSIKGKFSVINPNYKNSDKSVKTVIESSSDDFFTLSGYKTSRTGISIGTEFEQMNDMFINLEMSNYYEDLETSSTANSIVKKQEGNYFENLLTYTLKYNKLDQNYQPSDGFINTFSQTLPLISDDRSFENKFLSSAYHSLGDNVILSAQFYLNTINSLDDDVRISKRVFVPSRRLRGFESGKVGPKDGSQYIGGNYATALNLNSTIPNIFFENENLDFNVFLDIANIWEVDYNSSLDSNKIRSSTGIAVNWFSAIGPLSFSYAVPLTEAETDITENFRFQIGTSF
tara:strand:+ start:389 stop:2638 length:2250 start_codon:yes stop_codon:yes gene_type:complete